MINKTKEVKKKEINTDSVWNKKSSKLRTLTGKKVAEVNLKPETKMCGADGKAVEKKKSRKYKLGESKTAVVSWARMNPPTIGHEHLVEQLNIVSNIVEGVPMLILTKTIDKNNPLTLSEKQQLVFEAFDDYTNIIENDFSNIIEMLKVVSEEYDNIILVSGEDQLDSYNRILQDYNGKDFTFESATVISAGIRNPDSNDFVEQISATMLRESVKNNDMNSFIKGLPTKLQHKAYIIFEQIKNGLEIYNKPTNSLNEELKNRIKKIRFNK